MIAEDIRSPIEIVAKIINNGDSPVTSKYITGVLYKYRYATIFMSYLSQLQWLNLKCLVPLYQNTF